MTRKQMEQNLKDDLLAAAKEEIVTNPLTSLTKSQIDQIDEIAKISDNDQQFFELLAVATMFGHKPTPIKLS